MWQWTQWGGCAFTMHGASIVHQSSAMYQKYCWYVLTWYMIQLEQYLPKCTFNFTFFKTVILKTLLLLLYYRTLIQFYLMLNKFKIEPKFWLPIILITTSETYFEIKKTILTMTFFLSHLKHHLFHHPVFPRNTTQQQGERSWEKWIRNIPTQSIA